MVTYIEGERVVWRKQWKLDFVKETHFVDLTLEPYKCFT